MKLALYSSVSRGDVPNLVGLQEERIVTVPTVLVCPLKAGLELTPLRVAIPHEAGALIACPELTRPIHRRALRALGYLEEPLSREIMHRFLGLLAR